MEKEIMKKELAESILKEIKENKPDEETTVQIRLFDNRVGTAFYKQLTQKELSVIMNVLSKI